MEINKIIQGDCIEELRKLPDNSVDLILTDPPYNIGKDFHNDDMEEAEFLWWANRWIVELTRVLKWGGAIYITVGFQIVAEVKLLFDKCPDIRLKNWIVWYRQDGWKGDKGFAQTHEHILYFIKKPIDKLRVTEFRRWLNNHREKKELSFSDINRHFEWATTGGGVASGYMGNKKHMQIPAPTDYKKLKELLELDDSYDDLIEEKYIKFNKTDNGEDVWVDIRSERKRLGHPTQKPVKLFERMIKASTNEGDVVLDCFAGSGTTAVACRNLNRNYICIEKDINFYDMIKKRINQKTLLEVN